MVKYILAFDISGNFLEGKGTTGYTLLNVQDNKLAEVGIVSANSAECQEEYWLNHILLIQRILKDYGKDIVIRCEDYLLYAHKANNQIQSHFETPQLIGVIKYWCYVNNVPLFIRSASTVKSRWTNEILERKGYITKCTSFWLPVGCTKHRLTCHELDSIRHAVACYYFDLEMEK